jgi:hypothetical protein
MFVVIKRVVWTFLLIGTRFRSLTKDLGGVGAPCYTHGPGHG